MGVLLMLMSIGGVILAAVLLVISWLNDSAWLKKFVFGSVVIWFGFYGLLLIGTSLLSAEKILGLNDPKEFCGFYLDCHLHAAVSGVKRTKTIGDRSAAGEFYVVTVAVSSDARRAHLGLLAVDAHVVDGAGAKYTRDERAESRLAPQPEFEEQIAPGQKFEKDIVFDLPLAAVEPKLDVREGFGIDIVIEKFLIGDEDSILHKRAYFNISDQYGHAGLK